MNGRALDPHTPVGVRADGKNVRNGGLPPGTGRDRILLAVCSARPHLRVGPNGNAAISAVANGGDGPQGSWEDGPMAENPLRALVGRANAYGYIHPKSGGRKMAKQIKLKGGKTFDFGKKASVSVYPWDAWLNGDLLLLERSDVTWVPETPGDTSDKGEWVQDPSGTVRDFTVERDAMPGKLKFAGRRRYKIVQISKRDADGRKLANEGLIIQARDMTPDEIVAEDELRAEEKAGRADKKAAKKAEATATQPTDGTPPAATSAVA